MVAFGHEGMEDGHNHQNSYTAKPRGRRINATVCLFERVLYRWNSVKLVLLPLVHIFCLYMKHFHYSMPR
uniref:Uncharacterized protein n=1 Tax=Anguilla anguilla TaxID=7936 RepID=A0A0E9WCJ9_ANGAN